MKQPAKMPVEDATAMIYNVNLSLNQYQMIRSLCLPYKFHFPTRNNINAHISIYHPPVKSFELKSEVNIIQLLSETSQSLLELSSNSRDVVISDLKLIGKFGLDGSGSHKVRHQLINKSNADIETPHLVKKKHNSILLTCYCPLELSSNGTILWSNPVPNSTAYTRPISLVRGVEDRDIISTELELHFDVIKEPFFVLLDSGATVTCHTELSMVDGKMVGLLQGDTGAFCHYCHTTRADANDISVIADGFNITKDYESCKTAWQKLVNGDIPYHSAERQGQCHEPLVKSSLFCFSVLHFKLRTLDFVQKILYHLVAGVKTWSEGVDSKRRLQGTKKTCIDHIRSTTGILIDTPNECGGNTNSGPIADRFFDIKNRNNICALILDEEDKQNYNLLLSKFWFMIKVSQHLTEKKVNIGKVKDLGEDIMHFLKNSFLNEKGESWINIIPSVHQMCAHAWELFSLNDSSNISKWSESPVESWNKHVRSFQSGTSSRAQQVSVKENIHDIFVRMLISSHPSIASKKNRPTCSVCGEVGHTARSVRHRNKDASLPKGDDEVQLESFFYR